MNLPTATDPLAHRVMACLRYGKAAPTPAKEIADTVGISPRQVGAIIADLIDDGILIGSLCESGHHGYFLPRTVDDLETGVSHIVSRAAKSFQRVRRLRRAAERQFGQEVLTLFDLDADAGAVRRPGASPNRGVGVQTPAPASRSEAVS